MRVAMVRSKSPMGIEPRVEREASTLSNAGHEVHVLLWDRTLEHSDIEKREDFTIHRYRAPAPEGQIGLLPRMAGWWTWEFRELTRLRPDVVHSCDFDTILPACSYANLQSIRLVYDIFDFYAYMIALPLGSVTRSLLARLERFFARKADLVIIADMARRIQLGEDFKGKLVEIMNTPTDVAIQEKEEPEFTVFYGGMISWERGLRQLVEGTEKAGIRLVVAGHGADEAEFVPLFKRKTHVDFLGNITYDEVLRWTMKSQLIAALYDPSIPNNRLAAPNKLFEAMMFSKPVVTNKGIRPSEIVNEVGCGVVVKYDDAKDLAKALRKLATDEEERMVMGRKGRMAFEERYNWTAMEKRLIDAYSSL